MRSTLENDNFESDFADNDSANKLLHFRNFTYVLNNIDDYPRKPDHAESLYELDQINRYLCFKHFDEKVVDLSVTERKKIDQTQTQIDEVVQIGEWVYLYCATFEQEKSSVEMQLKHCDTMMAFLEMKKSLIRYKYIQQTEGEMPNHEEMIEEIDGINNEKKRIERLISKIN